MKLALVCAAFCGGFLIGLMPISVHAGVRWLQRRCVCALMAANGNKLLEV